MRVVHSLLRGDAPLIQQALHKRVICRDLLELPVRARAQTVGSGIANMRQLNLVTINEQGGAGGAHPRQPRILMRQIVNDAVRALNLIRQVHARGAVKIGVIQRGQVKYRCGGRDVTAHVPAHAVGNHGKIPAPVAGIIIFAAAHTHIGACRETEGNLHRLPPQLHGGATHPKFGARLNDGGTAKALTVHIGAVR